MKYFCEDAPEYHVAVAGSLLGITMRQGESVPVGKVDVLHMYPMTYDEFLLAKGKEQMCDILKSKDWKTIKLLRGEYIKILREYYFVGGMPEAVKRFLKTNDPNQVRDVQYEILYTYQKDISKHVPTSESNRINMVWQSMPSQLAKENKKFMYGVAKKGGRAKDFEVAIQWLLGAMSETAPESLLVAANGMEEAKGAFTQNYVMSQLVASRRNSVFYYSSGNKLELDFLIQHGTEIVPIEAKAEENLRSKSLASFVSSYPGMHGIRFSMSDYREQEWMTNIPLYAVSVYF